MRLGTSAFLALSVCPIASSAQEGGERPAFENPPIVQSADGVLAYEMTVAPTAITVGGENVTTLLYNGLFAPPTLSLDPGETLKLHLVNKRDDDSTNVHYHGTNVSPKVPSDNVFIEIRPGESYDYTVDFPQNHPEGLFWYHPHWHGTTEYQIGSGLSGLISVGDVLSPWPELKGITTRYLILRDIQIVDGKVPNPPDPGNPTMRLVNGLKNPTMPIRPGEVQLWRVGNIGADVFYDLEIEGHKIYELARDGIRHNQPVVYDNLMLPTSSRSEFLIVGGPAGEYTFRTRKIDMGPAGDPHPRTTLATLVSSGAPQTRIKLPTVFPQLADLRDDEICCQRTYDYSETPDGEQFCINNVGTDMGVINTRVRIGCVEEWTINNCTAENHTFHHHQLQFQVVKMNGEDVPFTGWQDNVIIPFRAATEEFPDRCKVDEDGNAQGCTCPTADDPYGSVVVRIPYTNDVIEGRAVYHCHIGEHEDNGMMQIIEMSKSAGRCEAGTPSTLDRYQMSSTERATCTPREDDHHDHAALPGGRTSDAPGGLWARFIALVGGGASAAPAAPEFSLSSMCYNTPTSVE